MKKLIIAFILLMFGTALFAGKPEVNSHGTFTLGIKTNIAFDDAHKKIADFIYEYNTNPNIPKNEQDSVHVLMGINGDIYITLCLMDMFHNEEYHNLKRRYRPKTEYYAANISDKIEVLVKYEFYRLKPPEPDTFRALVCAEEAYEKVRILILDMFGQIVPVSTTPESLATEILFNCQDSFSKYNNNVLYFSGDYSDLKISLASE